MPIGPTLIIDKSALQSLTIDEARWISHHFHPNLIEPLYIEIVGVLSASDRRDPTADLASLAQKMLGMGLTTTPNMRHVDLAVGNLLGMEFEMDGRVVIDPRCMKRIMQPDGKATLFFDEPPEIEALRRLARGEYNERELKGASLLRRFIDEVVDLNLIKGSLRLEGNVRDLSEALNLADAVIDGPGRRYRSLMRALDYLHLSDENRSQIIRRWKAANAPPLKSFAPFSYHLLRIDRFFDIGIGSGLISARDSKHYIDVMYLYYLPFCEVFVSTDKFHRQVAPYFMRSDQRFIWGIDFKAEATKLLNYYSAISEELRAQGAVTYARLPPKDGDFLTAKLFDELRPGWREWD